MKKSLERLHKRIDTYDAEQNNMGSFNDNLQGYLNSNTIGMDSNFINMKLI